MKGQTKPMMNARNVGRMKIGAYFRLGRCTGLTCFLVFAKMIFLSILGVRPLLRRAKKFCF